MVLAGTEREGDIASLTAPYYFELGMRWFLHYRSPTVEGATVEGLHHIERARSEGTGVILSFLHMGNYAMLFRALRNAGIDATVPAADDGFAPQLVGALGLERVQGQEHLRGMHVIPATGSYPELVAIVSAGGAVTIAFDVPGSTRTEMLGRTLGLKSGTARLAVDTGAPVLPLDVRRRGAHLVLRVMAPIRPAASVAETHRRLADTMGRLVMDRPEAVERPQWRYIEAPSAAPSAESKA